jgi:DNA repair exonuclease SbcCD nuclease subunit
VLDAFVRALEECIDRNVDFIIISGDLFDSNLPDMSLVDKAVKKMHEVRKNGIGIYVVYGSHDFSPNQSSIIDILASATLFDKITQGSVNENMLILKFKTDEKTGAKLVGISGYKSGNEIQYYDILDRDTLEKEEGFKIFVFHGMISEYKPHHLMAMESMPISYLPKNFNYYAGGHLHERVAGKIGKFDNVAYPGALFGADLRDIESSARGLSRGFYIVTFSDKEVIKMDFVEVSSCTYLLLEYNAMGKSSLNVQNDLERLVKESDVENKLVILKVKGEMASGKTADINFSALEKLLSEMGAAHTMITRSQLTSIEYSAIKVTEYNTTDIENRIFRESIGSTKVSTSKLRGEAGVKLSKSLLQTLKHGRKHNETKSVYETRIAETSIDMIGLTEELNIQ